MDNEDLKLQEEIETIKIWSELASTSSREKYKTLPTVCSLAATLLIIATFNEKLIPLTDYVRTLITSLLILIFISLWGFLYLLYRDEKVARTHLEKITKEKMRYNGISHLILDIFPYIIAVIFTCIIIAIILLIWQENFITSANTA